MRRSPLILAMRSIPALHTWRECSRDRVSVGLVLARGLFGGVAVRVFLFCSHSWSRRQVQEPLRISERLREIVIEECWPVMNGGD